MDLLIAARDGDEGAFLQLFQQHRLPLFRFAYRMTRSVADAEDIVQECFLELLRPGCAYDPAMTSLRTYLFGVVRNQSLRLLGSRSKQTEPDGATPHFPSPEGQLLRIELENAVARAVTALPNEMREVLILAHYEEMAIAEIATVIGVESTTVKSRLQRARADLRETLAAYMPRMGKR